MTAFAEHGQFDEWCHRQCSFIQVTVDESPKNKSFISIPAYQIASRKIVAA
jgi:hypothetical protein